MESDKEKFERVRSSMESPEKSTKPWVREITSMSVDEFSRQKSGQAEVSEKAVAEHAATRVTSGAPESETRCLAFRLIKQSVLDNYHRYTFCRMKDQSMGVVFSRGKSHQHGELRLSPRQHHRTVPPSIDERLWYETLKLPYRTNLYLRDAVVGSDREVLSQQQRKYTSEVDKLHLLERRNWWMSSASLREMSRIKNQISLIQLDHQEVQRVWTDKETNLFHVRQGLPTQRRRVLSRVLPIDERPVSTDSMMFPPFGIRPSFFGSGGSSKHMEDSRTTRERERRRYMSPKRDHPNVNRRTRLVTRLQPTWTRTPLDRRDYIGGIHPSETMSDADLAVGRNLNQPLSWAKQEKERKHFLGIIPGSTEVNVTHKRGTKHSSSRLPSRITNDTAGRTVLNHHLVGLPQWSFIIGLDQSGGFQSQLDTRERKSDHDPTQTWYNMYAHEGEVDESLTFWWQQEGHSKAKDRKTTLRRALLHPDEWSINHVHDQAVTWTQFLRSLREYVNRKPPLLGKHGTYQESKDPRTSYEVTLQPDFVRLPDSVTAVCPIMPTVVRADYQLIGVKWYRYPTLNSIRELIMSVSLRSRFLSGGKSKLSRTKRFLVYPPSKWPDSYTLDLPDIQSRDYGYYGCASQYRHAISGRPDVEVVKLSPKPLCIVPPPVNPVLRIAEVTGDSARYIPSVGRLLMNSSEHQLGVRSRMEHTGREKCFQPGDHIIVQCAMNPYHLFCEAEDELLSGLRLVDTIMNGSIHLQSVIPSSVLSSLKKAEYTGLSEEWMLRLEEKHANAILTCDSKPKLRIPLA
ncbi:unnamed protein product, partial [Dicrocoelium dendriticum]